MKFPGLVFAIPAWKAAGAAIVGGDRVAVAGAEAAFYICPALVEIGGQAGPVERETFAPVLYVIKYSFATVSTTTGLMHRTCIGQLSP